MFKGALEKRGLVQKEKRRAANKTQVCNQNLEILLSKLPEGRSLNKNFTDSGFMFEDASTLNRLRPESGRLVSRHE